MDAIISCSDRTAPPVEDGPADERPPAPVDEAELGDDEFLEGYQPV